MYHGEEHGILEKKARKAKISVVPNTAGKYYETYEPDMHSIVEKS